jgi:GT2 family glycosyltransferase
MVSVLMTTFNSASYLERCLDSVLMQSYSPIEIIVVDNASSDATREILRKYASRLCVFLNETNVGFAAGQNQAAAAAKGNWLLSLNPDVLLSTDFISSALALSDIDPSVGFMCGKLRRWKPGEPIELTDVLDSTGIYFTRSLRHLDRGADEKDVGQYEKPEYVFGATGAAAFYRREMYEHILAAHGEFFDESFFAYREDADLAWRSQLLGWKCLYVPKALAWHVRRVTPERRRALPLLINWHSVKNRFLMRAKNIGWRLYLRLLIPTTVRDLQVLGYSMIADRRLLSAFMSLWRLRKEVRRKRERIQAQRRVSDRELQAWFSRTPVSAEFLSSGKAGEIIAPPVPASISSKSCSY